MSAFKKSNKKTFVIYDIFPVLQSLVGDKFHIYSRILVYVFQDEMILILLLLLPLPPLSLPLLLLHTNIITTTTTITNTNNSNIFY